VKENTVHLAKISELNNEVIQLNSQLDHVMKQVKMMTTGTDVLDEILEGQIQGKPNGIGFTSKNSDQSQQTKTFAQALVEYGMAKKKRPVKDIKFVASTGINDPTASKGMLQHTKKHQVPKLEKVSLSRICHLCRKKRAHKTFLP
jgi:hypothetical protein